MTRLPTASELDGDQQDFSEEEREEQREERREERDRQRRARAGRERRFSIRRFLRGLGRYDVAIGPAFLALVYALYAATGAWYGLKIATLFNWAAGMPFLVLLGVVVGVGIAIILRGCKVHGVQLGIVGLVFAMVIIWVVGSTFFTAAGSREFVSSQYGFCEAWKKRNDALPPGCEKILRRGDPASVRSSIPYGLSLLVCIGVAVGMVIALRRAFLWLMGEPQRREVE